MSGLVGSSTPTWRTFLVKATFLTVALVLAFHYAAERYRVGFDWQVERCLPDTRAVLIDLQAGVPGRGDLIAFRGQGLQPLFADGTRMVKILVGLPGDQVEITEQRVLINGTIVAKGLALAPSLGHRPGDFARRFTIPKDHYFGVGTSQTSFDSRYFGLIAKAQVIGQAWRLG